MTRAYNTPELLEVGGLEEMVLGPKETIVQDTNGDLPTVSGPFGSVLDVD